MKVMEKEVRQFKDLMIAIPNPNHTRKECQDYLVKNHAFTAMSVRETRDVFVRYTGNPILTQEEMEGDTLYRRDTTGHIVIEHVTVSRDAYIHSFESKEYMEKVRPDEGYMVTEYQGGLPQFYTVEEHTIYTDNNRATGQYRIFDFVVKKPEVSKEEFIQGLKSESEELCKCEDFRSVIHARVFNVVEDVNPLFGKIGPYNAVLETIVDDPLVLVEYYENIRNVQKALVNQQQSISMITRQCVIK